MNQLRKPAAVADPTHNSDSEPLDPIGRRSPRDLPCHVHDPELWFAKAPRDLERAKALCATCPVRRGCLIGALQRSEPIGVWGGEIVQDGRVVPFKRPPGRPRIHFPAAEAQPRPRKSA